METQPKKDNDLTLDILTEFIEVLIHQVLHMRYNPLSLPSQISKLIKSGQRDLYPASIFKKHRKFNMPLQMSIQVSSSFHAHCTWSAKIFQNQSFIVCPFSSFYMPFVYIKSEEPSSNDLLFVGSPG